MRPSEEVTQQKYNPMNYWVIVIHDVLVAHPPYTKCHVMSRHATQMSKQVIKRFKIMQPT